MADNPASRAASLALCLKKKKAKGKAAAKPLAEPVTEKDVLPQDAPAAEEVTLPVAESPVEEGTEEVEEVEPNPDSSPTTGEVSLADEPAEPSFVPVATPPRDELLVVPIRGPKGNEPPYPTKAQISWEDCEGTPALWELLIAIAGLGEDGKKFIGLFRGQLDRAAKVEDWRTWADALINEFTTVAEKLRDMASEGQIRSIGYEMCLNGFSEKAEVVKKNGRDITVSDDFVAEFRDLLEQHWVVEKKKVDRRHRGIEKWRDELQAELDEKAAKLQADRDQLSDDLDLLAADRNLLAADREANFEARSAEFWALHTTHRMFGVPRAVELSVGYSFKRAGTIVPNWGHPYFQGYLCGVWLRWSKALIREGIWFEADMAPVKDPKSLKKPAAPHQNKKTWWDGIAAGLEYEDVTDSLTSGWLLNLTDANRSTYTPLPRWFRSVYSRPEWMSTM